MEHIHAASRIGSHRRHAAELPAVGHGVGLLAEADVHAVLQQTAFVRVPALLGVDRRETHKCQ